MSDHESCMQRKIRGQKEWEKRMTKKLSDPSDRAGKPKISTFNVTGHPGHPDNFVDTVTFAMTDPTPEDLAEWKQVTKAASVPTLLTPEQHLDAVTLFEHVCGWPTVLRLIEALEGTWREAERLKLVEEAYEVLLVRLKTKGIWKELFI